MSGVREVRRTAGRRTAAVALALGAGLALAGCTTSSSATLLDADDVEGVEEATHDEDGAWAPGWTWCDDLNPYRYVEGGELHTSLLSFGGGAGAGATIIDGSSDGVTADYLLETIEARAGLCAENETALDRGYAIEPLSGLDAGVVGWRTEASDGEHGEFALVRLDGRRLLAVGWVSDAPEAPVELGELIRLAREGAERVGS